MAAPHNKFTDEQIAYFKSNRHVRNVSRSFVYFNDEFKEQFGRMYNEGNLLPQEILLRLGVDYEMLGRNSTQQMNVKCLSFGLRSSICGRRTNF
jgi:hypothetical protein